MSQPSSSDSPRREFLQRLVGAGVAAAGTSLLAGCAAGAQSAGVVMPTPVAGPWDMSWTTKLGKYRTAYDSPEIYGGAALFYAQAAMRGYREIGVGASEVTPVLILRHTASVMVLNDAMWAKLNIGETNKLKDPSTGETTKRNPFVNYVEGDKFAMVESESSLAALMKRGAIIIACNNALRRVSYALRQKDSSLTAEQALAEIRAAVIPGAYVMPNGIFAVSAAQDAGCHYMRVLT